MMKKTGMILFLLMITGMLGCGYSPGSSPGVSVTISPLDGSINQAFDVDVTASFGTDVTQPQNWIDAFMLKLTDEGETLCTEVVYSSTGALATCVHDDLDPNTQYLVILTGVVAVNGKRTVFTTGE